jgi:hypothetical protein
MLQADRNARVTVAMLVLGPLIGCLQFRLPTAAHFNCIISRTISRTFAQQPVNPAAHIPCQQGSDMFVSLEVIIMSVFLATVRCAR